MIMENVKEGNTFLQTWVHTQTNKKSFTFPVTFKVVMK